MGKWMIAAASILASATEPPTRSALVAAGRCDDPELVERSEELTRLLAEQMGQQLLQREDLTTRLPPSASRAPVELERQLEGAERHYFGAEYAAAEERVLDALVEIERLKPGPRRWQLYRRGVLLRALILRARHRPTDAEEQFRRVLRLDPAHRLDANYFPPSARARFDRLRRHLRSEPRATLAVTSTPGGSEIFVDGLAVAPSTPATLDLVAGRYSVVVSKDGRFSFPRVVDLTSSSSVHFDLDFEGSVHSAMVPCFEDASDEQSHLKNAVKLGSWLGIDQVVLVRSDRRSAGYTWISAGLVQVGNGQNIREGGIKVDSSEASSRSLGELAEFISTGKAGHNVVASEVAPVLSIPGRAAAEANLDSIPSLPILEKVARVGARREPSRWPKLVGASLIGLGTLAVGSGMLFQVRSDRSWAELNRRYADGVPPAIAELPTVRSTRRQAEWQRRAALVSYGLGVGAVCAGAIVLLTGTPGSGRSPSVSLGVLPGAFSIAGTWH